MKAKRSLIAITLSLILAMSLGLASCAKEEPGDVESLIKSNKSVMSEIEQAGEAAGMTVEIEGNDVIYIYDLANAEGITEEIAKDDAMVSALQSQLDSMGSTFAPVAQQIEEETGYNGVQIVVRFTYGDEVVAEQTFTSAS